MLVVIEMVVMTMVVVIFKDGGGQHGGGDGYSHGVTVTSAPAERSVSMSAYSLDEKPFGTKNQM